MKSGTQFVAGIAARERRSLALVARWAELSARKGNRISVLADQAAQRRAWACILFFFAEVMQED